MGVWSWVNGRAVLSGIQLRELDPRGLYDVLFVMWVDWHLSDKEHYDARTKLVNHLRNTVRMMESPDEDSLDNPFPGVMREGPMGVVG